MTQERKTSEGDVKKEDNANKVPQENREGKAQGGKLNTDTANADK